MLSGEKIVRGVLDDEAVKSANTTGKKEPSVFGDTIFVRDTIEARRLVRFLDIEGACARALDDPAPQWARYDRRGPHRQCPIAYANCPPTNNSCSKQKRASSIQRLLTPSIPTRMLPWPFASSTLLAVLQCRRRALLLAAAAAQHKQSYSPDAAVRVRGCADTHATCSSPFWQRLRRRVDCVLTPASGLLPYPPSDSRLQCTHAWVREGQVLELAVLPARFVDALEVLLFAVWASEARPGVRLVC
ncbi:hypothetical protein C8R45DRAFT_1101671 [Mycena sanguinolenta]|nr:hypothetical protein C8R45DRAFT_1101671 [Mycena sanguinolenta]